MHKILNKFKNASPVAKASMAFLFANFVLKGLSLISGPIFTRIMTTSQYGIVSTYFSWKDLLTVIVTLNLSSGVFNNGMLDYKEDRDSFQYSLLTISTISAFIFFIVYFCFKDFFNNLFEIPVLLIYIMFAYFLFIPAYLFWSGRNRYEFKYKALTCIIICVALFSTIFSILAVLSVPNNKTAITRVVVNESVNIVVGLVFFVYISVKAKFKCKIEYCKYALKFNLPLLPHYLSMYVLASLDRIMITKMVSSSATAIYSVAYTVASVINIVWQSIDASLSPWIYEKLAFEDYKAVKNITKKIVLLFAIMCVACTLFAPEIMAVLAPTNYSVGMYVIPSVAAGVYFTAVYCIYMRIELYYKKTLFATFATSCAAISNIILNYIFIKQFGFIAAGYTTLACYALLYVLHYFNVRLNGFSYIVDNKTIFFISLFVIVSAIAITFLYANLFMRYVAIALILCLLIVKRKKIIAIIKSVK